MTAKPPAEELPQLGLSTEQFRELYVRFRPLLLRVMATRMMPEAAEDAMEQAFLHAFLARGSYNPTLGSKRQWLLGIAWRTCNRLLADDYRQREVTEEWLDAEAIEGLPKHDPALSAELQHLMDELDEPNREIIRRSFWRDQSSTEIGAALGMLPSAVRKRVSRILAMWREALTRK